MMSTKGPGAPQRPLPPHDDRPNSCTYWVSDYLLAGEHPARRGDDKAETSRRLRQYLSVGIALFVDLTEKGEKFDYEGLLRLEGAASAATANAKGGVVQHKRLPIPDFGIPTRDQMKEILDAIDEAGADNRKVYVHCRGGIGRMGTVVGCYLRRHNDNMTGDEALDETNRLFRSSDRSLESWCSPETHEQMNFVKDWSEHKGS